MLVDHIGAILFPQYLGLRIVGRIAFPIFAYTLVEGFMHTHDVRKYMLRLGALALISEIPFDLAFSGSVCSFGRQNVFFTLFFAMIAMAGIQFAEQKFQNLWLMRGSQLLFVAVVCMAANGFCCDYGAKGVLMVVILYLCRYHRPTQMLAGCIAFAWEITAPLAFIPISRYNGKRGLRLKYFFYVFYPVHLLILYGILHLLQ